MPSRLHPAALYGRVYVLRLGHRPERDKRVTTHVGLVARAFGANGFILEGPCDEGVMMTLRGVLERWGGSMELECGVNGKSYVRSWKERGGDVVHLTMYGMPLSSIIDEIASRPWPKLVVVGAEKVERFYYEEATFNVAVGNQPHSEVAALAIFLDRLFRGSWEQLYFEDAKLVIHPSPRGKAVERR